MNKDIYYFAGKIGYGDWRTKVLGSTRISKDYLSDSVGLSEWEVDTFNSVYGPIDYSGPFFMSCDHGCYHGTNQHGLGLSGEGGCCVGTMDTWIDNVEGTDKKQKLTWNLCCKAIMNCTTLFAWIDDPTCYGTLVEIGMARALKKRVVVASPKKLNNMWFAACSAHQIIIAPNAVEAFGAMFSDEERQARLLEVANKKKLQDAEKARRFAEWEADPEAYRLKVEHRMFPILVGKLGGGKTESLRKLNIK